MEKVIKSEYLAFVWKEQEPKRKTKDMLVYSKDGTCLLGWIKFYNRWRQYSFQPEPNTIYDTKCLTDIVTQIDTMNKELRQTWAKK